MNETGSTSRRLAAWVAGFSAARCSLQAMEEAKRRIFDLMISSAAGWRVNALYNRAVCAVFLPQGGEPQSTVFFTGRRLPAATAAYLNATFGHGADIDDGHRIANGHPGVAVIPAVLALAEARGASEKQICEAVLAGYEVYLRVSMAVQPALLRRGFHGTGAVGAVAASAACAKLLGLDAARVHNAISLGAVQASGLFEVSESGQMAKPVNPANACRTGVESALLAEAGVQAPEAPFEGKKGFFKAFSGDVHPERITDGLGGEPLIGSCYIKLSPACRHTHPAIDAGIALGKRRAVTPQTVQSIEIATYPNADFVTGAIAKPKNADEAKFSMRYALAMALQRGRYSFPELSEAGDMSEATSALIDRMTILPDPCFENAAEGLRGGRVTIYYADGAEDSCFVKVPKGESGNPMQPQDLTDKMRACCLGVFTDEEQQQLERSVMGGSLRFDALMRLMAAKK